ncbi:MAG: SNF2-related protein [Thermaerobacter sp.]|nr:SNF2-related protein [Thermaerobacter sp.]
MESETLALARRLTAWPELAVRLGHSLDLHRYQVESALRVTGPLGGRAILADEVGLGKTIEAGLVIAELRARGLVESVLVLVPAGLKRQWDSEMRQKFGWLPMQSARDRGWIWVLSIDTAKRSPLLEQLQVVPWDLLIVDEAHRLKNPRTLNYRLVAGITAKHLLLLTATPLENRLTELYALVNLVKPGLFGSYLRFYGQFMLNPRTPKNAAALRQLLSRVMVRRQRREVGREFPPRQVSLWPIRLGVQERQLYDTLTFALRREYRQRLGGRETILPLITLQRELCSSPQALLPTLRAATWLGPLQERLLGLATSVSRTAKVEAVGELLERMAGKVLIFTEYRATQAALIAELAAQGIPVRGFHGGLSAGQRDAAVAWFRGPGRVLVSTEAGGQGINLQFCHQLINFDLPWNPMRIEQRIGRVHRLGQTRPVAIYNLFSVATIEENILELLHEKIDLFRHVIGELDVILRQVEHRGTLSSRLLDIFLGEERPEMVRARITELANEFLAARARMEPSATAILPPESGEAGAQPVH